MAYQAAKILFSPARICLAQIQNGHGVLSSSKVSSLSANPWCSLWSYLPIRSRSKASLKLPLNHHSHSRFRLQTLCYAFVYRLYYCYLLYARGTSSLDSDRHHRCAPSPPCPSLYLLQPRTISVQLIPSECYNKPLSLQTDHILRYRCLPTITIRSIDANYSLFTPPTHEAVISTPTSPFADQTLIQSPPPAYQPLHLHRVHCDPALP